MARSRTVVRPFSFPPDKKRLIHLRHCVCMPELNDNPKRVFLCHSWIDKVEVRQLYHRLRSDGADPWLDEEDMLAGQDLHAEIQRAIQSSGIVIIFLSVGSLSKIGFVNGEIGFTLDVADEQPEGAIFVIPARLEACELPLRLRRRLAVNLFEPGGYEKLLKSLRSKGLLNPPPAPAPGVSPASDALLRYGPGFRPV